MRKLSRKQRKLMQEGKLKKSTSQKKREKKQRERQKAMIQTKRAEEMRQKEKEEKTTKRFWYVILIAWIAIFLGVCMRVINGLVEFHNRTYTVAFVGFGFLFLCLLLYAIMVIMKNRKR